MKRNVLLLVLVVLMSTLLSACQSQGVTFMTNEALAAGRQAGPNMAARIQFQDRVLGGRALGIEASDVNGPGADMAARIQFQDRVWEQTMAVADFAGEQSIANAEITMADRIHFHDQLWEKGSPGAGAMSMGDRIRFHDQLWESGP